MHQFAVFLDVLHQARTLAPTGDRGQKVQRGGVLIREGNGMEGHRQAGEGVGAGLPEEAGGTLAGLHGDEDGRVGAAHKPRKCRGDGLPGIPRLDVADHGDDHVVRDIAAVIIVHQFGACDGFENVAQADDGIMIGVDRIGGLKEEFIQFPLGAVFVHAHFPEDDFLFPLPFILGE